MNLTKRCSKCGEDKPHSKFRPDPRYRDGLQGPCKDCKSAAHRKYRSDPEFRKRANDRKKDYYKRVRCHRKHIENWKVRFGLSPERYYEMLDNQNGGCAICGTESPGAGNKHFCVDHCHSSGQIRGLLCRSCNVALGLVNDDKSVLTKMIEYIKAAEHRGETGPDDVRTGQIN